MITIERNRSVISLLSSLFVPRGRVVDLSPQASVEVFPNINQKISQISSEIYPIIRLIGHRPYGGDMWAEKFFNKKRVRYWIQADNNHSLIINTTSGKEMQNLHIVTNNLEEPIFSRSENCNPLELLSKCQFLLSESYCPKKTPLRRNI